MGNKNRIKILTLLILLQCPSTVFSLSIFGDDGFGGLIAKYKAGDLEVVPALLKEMSEVKAAHQKQAILGFLNIKHDENNRDVAFDKAQSNLKESYLKHSLQIPSDLSDIISGYLKEYKLIKDFNVKSSIRDLQKLSNDRLAILLLNGTIQIWDLKAIKLIATFSLRPESGSSIKRLNNEKLAELVDGFVYIWDLKTYTRVDIPGIGENSPWRAVISLLDGDKLALGYFNNNLGKIQIWDLKTYTLIKTIATGSSIVSAIKSLDNDRLAVGFYGGKIQIWDLKTNQLIKTIPAHSKTDITSLEKLDDDKLVSGSSKGDVRVWDLKTGKLINAIPTKAKLSVEKIQRLYGDNLAVGFTNGKIEIWNLTTYKLIKDIQPEDGSEVAFDSLGADGLVLGFSNGTVEIWKEELDIRTERTKEEKEIQQAKEDLNNAKKYLYTTKEKLNLINKEELIQSLKKLEEALYQILKAMYDSNDSQTRQSLKAVIKEEDLREVLKLFLDIKLFVMTGKPLKEGDNAVSIKNYSYTIDKNGIMHIFDTNKSENERLVDII